MSYNTIGHKQLKHRVLSRVFRNANLHLSDIYAMFSLPVPGSGHGAGCNFPIVLCLLCIIDGLARDVYPTLLVKDQETRFKQLIRERLYWGPRETGWIDKNEAASLLYLEFRNPLVHELAQDKASRTRRTGYGEPVIGKWGAVPENNRDIARIEAMKQWDDSWPTITSQQRGNRKVMKLTASSLYWSVKKLVRDLALDDETLKFAELAQAGIKTFNLSA